MTRQEFEFELADYARRAKAQKESVHTPQENATLALELVQMMAMLLIQQSESSVSTTEH